MGASCDKSDLSKKKCNKGSSIYAVLCPGSAGSGAQPDARELRDQQNVFIIEVRWCTQPTHVVLEHDFIVLTVMQGNEKSFYSVEKVNSDSETSLEWQQSPTLQDVYKKCGYGGEDRDKPSTRKSRHLDSPGVSLGILRKYVSQHLDTRWKPDENCQHFAEKLYDTIGMMADVMQQSLQAPRAALVADTVGCASEAMVKSAAAIGEGLSGIVERVIEDSNCVGPRKAAHIPLSDIRLLRFSRHPESFEKALLNSPDLKPIRESLENNGYQCVLDNGAKIFVNLEDYKAAQMLLGGQKVGPTDVVIYKDWASFAVQSVKGGTAHSDNVKLKSNTSLGYLDVEQHSVRAWVKKGFLHTEESGTSQSRDRRIPSASPSTRSSLRGQSSSIANAATINRSSSSFSMP